MDSLWLLVTCWQVRDYNSYCGRKSVALGVDRLSLLHGKFILFCSMIFLCWL